MAYSKTLLLDKVIQQYLKAGEPVGSETLKNALEINISSATIRNYFKVLMQEGVLIQSHTSSGRIPTNAALKNYWRSKLTYLEFKIKDLKALKKACEDFGIFVFLRQSLTQNFMALHNFENQFLILHFSHDAVAIPYQAKFEKFLSELIGLSIHDMKKIAYQVMANGLFEKLSALPCHHNYCFGLNGLGMILQNPHYHELFLDLIKGEMLDKIPKGTFFEPILPEGLMGILQETRWNHEDRNTLEMLSIGALNHDYEAFYARFAA